MNPEDFLNSATRQAMGGVPANFNAMSTRSLASYGSGSVDLGAATGINAAGSGGQSGGILVCPTLAL